MMKKSLALGLFVLSLGSVFSMSSSYASSFRDEYDAARVQQQIMNNIKESKIQSKIDTIKAEISANEAEIRRLQDKRSILDHDLAVQYQMLEVCNYASQRSQIRSKINVINSKIRSNESKIKSLEKKRTRLDHKLAVQLQLSFSR